MKYQRQIDLIQYINLKGNATIIELLDEFKISKATLNRDLTDLVNEGCVQKVHGGVISKMSSQVFELSCTKKEIYNKEYKEKIAKVACDMIHSNESVILDSGSTMFYVAKELALRENIENLTVITCDLKVAYTLSKVSNISLIVLGGIKHKESYDLFGPTVVELLQSLNVNKYFMATSAFHAEKGITHTDYDDIITKTAMLNCAAKNILCVDSSKYGLIKQWSLCDFTCVDTIITDNHFKENDLRELNSLCNNIIFADK
ncbi:MAG: DeoR/GlpR family DNA-binding transcription regulator [Erysipelotrichaceae bacterium]